MFALNAHPQLRKIGHDTLSHVLSAEIVEDAQDGYATIGAQHESSMLWLGEERVWCDSHHYLQSIKWFSDRKVAYAPDSRQDIPRIGYLEGGSAAVGFVVGESSQKAC